MPAQQGSNPSLLNQLQHSQATNKSRSSGVDAGLASKPAPLGGQSSSLPSLKQQSSSEKLSKQSSHQLAMSGYHNLSFSRVTPTQGFFLNDHKSGESCDP